MLRYFSETLELPQRLAQAVPTQGRRRKHAVPLVLYAFLVGSLLGIEKLAHLEWLRGEPSESRGTPRTSRGAPGTAALLLPARRAGLRVHNRWVLRLPVNAQIEAMWAYYDRSPATG